MKFLFTTPIRWLLVCTLGLLALVTPATTSAALAAPGFAYYWSLTFDYENNFNGVLHVAVGYAENGGVQNPPLHSQEFAVPCQRLGNVSLVGGAAQFNGGYLACNLDLKSALQATFVKCNELVPGCTLTIGDVERYRSFRMTANVTSTAAGSALLFYHEDANYVVTPAISNAQVGATLNPLGTLQSSSLSAALGVAHTYQSSYLCGLGGCNLGFAIDAFTENLPQGNHSVEFSTPLTTIYVGYNPASNSIIPAGTQIAHLLIDPPNLGNN